MKFSETCKYSDTDKQILVEEYKVFRSIVDGLEKDTPYYVYVLFEPNGTPRYIGKGKGMRGLSHIMNYVNNKGNINRYLKVIMDSNDEPLITKIYKPNLTEQEALHIEKELISLYGRFFEGSTLTNIMSHGYESPDSYLSSLGGKIGGTCTKESKSGIFSKLWDRSEETKRRWAEGIISKECFEHIVTKKSKSFQRFGYTLNKIRKGHTCT